MEIKSFEGWFIYDCEVTQSTNDDALIFSLPKDFCNGFVFSAQKQMNGRGRLGRKWSGGDDNLLFSALFKYDSSNVGMLSIACGISILKTILSFSQFADVKLKWPNDVLLNGKKVCGILIERKDEKHMVAGIGVNINSYPLLTDVNYETTSLKEAKIIVSREEFLSKFLKIFNQYLEKIRKKEFDSIKQTWQDYAKGINKSIEIKNLGYKVCGKLIGIDDSGAVLVVTQNGEEVVCAGDVIYKEE